MKISNNSVKLNQLINKADFINWFLTIEGNNVIYAIIKSNKKGAERWIASIKTKNTLKRLSTFVRFCSVFTILAVLL